MKLQISPRAYDDIAEIKRYISTEYDNRAAANRIANRITKSCRQLEQNPYMGRSLNVLSGKRSDYRFLVCDNYLIFYTVGEKIVSVDRVIHGKRDYYKVLFEGETEGDLKDIVKL